MSIDATRWAWEQVCDKATDKFVLLSMADRADEHHCCYPSIQRLAEDTQLNRKTVMECIRRLESRGLIEADRSNGRHTKYRLIGVHGRHETSPKIGTGGRTLTGPKNGTASSPKTGTGPKNGTSTKNGHDQSQKRDRTSPKNGTLTYQEPTKNLPSAAQLRAHARETAIADNHAHPTELVATLAELGFRAEQVHTPKVMAMLRRWQSAGVTPDTLRQLVITLRARTPNREFGPAYLDAPMHDYLEALNHAQTDTGSTTRHSGHRQRTKAEMFWDNIGPGLAIPWDAPDP